MGHACKHDFYSMLDFLWGKEKRSSVNKVYWDRKLHTCNCKLEVYFHLWLGKYHKLSGFISKLRVQFWLFSSFHALLILLIGANALSIISFPSYKFAKIRLFDCVYPHTCNVSSCQPNGCCSLQSTYCTPTIKCSVLLSPKPKQMKLQVR